MQSVLSPLLTVQSVLSSTDYTASSLSSTDYTASSLSSTDYTASFLSSTDYAASSLSSTYYAPVLSPLLTMEPVFSPLLTMQPVLSPLLINHSLRLTDNHFFLTQDCFLRDQRAKASSTINTDIGLSSFLTSTRSSDSSDAIQQSTEQYSLPTHTQYIVLSF